MHPLAIAAWILVALLALVLVALAAPVDVDTRVEVDDGRVRHATRVRALFGLVRFTSGSGAARAEPARERERAPRRFSIVAALEEDDVAVASWRFARRAWRALRLRAWSLRVRFGLEDPADAGIAMALVAPFTPLLLLPPRGSWILEPTFEGDALRAAFAATVRAWPLRVAAALVALLATPAVWRGWRAGRRWAR